jgi:hypothetical protein
MNPIRNVGPHLVLWVVAGMVSLISSPTLAQRDMGCSPTVANPCTGGGGGGSNSTATPAYNYEAERQADLARQRRRAAQEAERARQAERNRQQQAEVQREFIRTRDATALKGAGGTFASPNDGGLKDGGDAGLKVRGGEQTLKGSTASSQPSRNKRLTAPNTDPSVADARVPRDGAYLTAQIPELARSPAADRISKGFQAVMNHDWPVALAWWQDALQRDPGNASLKRSVELAQWMVDRRKAVAARPATPFSLAVHAASRGENAEAIRQLEIAKAGNPAGATRINAMIETIRKKDARKAKDAAITADIVKQQIELVGTLNDAGLKMLMVGKDKEAQKNFDNAQFYAMGLSPAQIKSYDSPDFGSMNAAKTRQSPNQSSSPKTKP